MYERKKKILMVDDDKSLHIATKYILRHKYDIISAFNGDEAKLILQNQKIDIVLLDLHMRRHEEGLEYLPSLKEIDSDVDFIIVSANTELDLATRVMRAGASAYLLKDHSPEQLLITIESVLSKREVVRENQHYVRDRKRILDRNQIIGNSEAISQLMRDIEKVKRSRANVIITAETGCGKELVARHIGAVDGVPFVAVDSATISSSMAESHLFGHEKGAFTGAHSQTKGLFEEADGGTIYFDEIANMPLEIEAKLLRVIQEKEINRLGSTKIIPLDFRVICASNKKFEQLIAEGKFKDDLYQRLNVISLHIPPLRERSSDIPMLIEHFFQKYGTDHSPQSFSNDSMDLLLRYSWPGNVRELSNLVANLCTMISDQEIVEVGDLPQKIRDEVYRTASVQASTASNQIDLSNSSIQNSADFYQLMHEMEGQVLGKLYKRYEGNVSQMSKNLKISRSHLYSKLTAHRIHV